MLVNHQEQTVGVSRKIADLLVRGTMGSLPLPQLTGESVNAFYLPPASPKPTAWQAVFDVIGRNAGLRCERNA
jgi:hypothetical protein